MRGRDHSHRGAINVIIMASPHYHRLKYLESKSLAVGVAYVRSTVCSFVHLANTTSLRLSEPTSQDPQALAPAKATIQKPSKFQ